MKSTGRSRRQLSSWVPSAPFPRAYPRDHPDPCQQPAPTNWLHPGPGDRCPSGERAPCCCCRWPAGRPPPGLGCGAWLAAARGAGGAGLRPRAPLPTLPLAGAESVSRHGGPRGGGGLDVGRPLACRGSGMCPSVPPKWRLPPSRHMNQRRSAHMHMHIHAHMYSHAYARTHTSACTHTHAWHARLYCAVLFPWRSLGRRGAATAPCSAGASLPRTGRAAPRRPAPPTRRRDAAGGGAAPRSPRRRTVCGRAGPARRGGREGLRQGRPRGQDARDKSWGGGEGGRVGGGWGAGGRARMEADARTLDPHGARSLAPPWPRGLRASVCASTRRALTHERPMSLPDPTTHACPCLQSHRPRRRRQLERAGTATGGGRGPAVSGPAGASRRRRPGPG